MTEFMYYENYGYRIKFPKEWVVKDQGIDVDVIFMEPTPPFASNLNVVTQKFAEGEIDFTVDQLLEAAIDEMKKVVPEASNFKTKSRKFLNSDGREMRFTGKEGKFDLKLLTALTIEGNNTRIITYTADSKKFEDNLDAVNEMINSLELI